jgi:hypothetical protein
MPNINDTAIANTGATKHYLIPMAPVTNINYNAATSTISTATGQLLQLSAEATINIPWLPPGTSTGKIMPDFVNNLLSMGVFCDANCTVTSPNRMSRSTMPTVLSYRGASVKPVVPRCGEST